MINSELPLLLYYTEPIVQKEAIVFEYFWKKKWTSAFLGFKTADLLRISTSLFNVSHNVPYVSAESMSRTHCDRGAGLGRVELNRKRRSMGLECMHVDYCCFRSSECSWHGVMMFFLSLKFNQKLCEINHSGALWRSRPDQEWAWWVWGGRACYCCSWRT